MVGQHVTTRTDTDSPAPLASSIPTARACALSAGRNLSTETSGSADLRLVTGQSPLPAADTTRFPRQIWCRTQQSLFLHPSRAPSGPVMVPGGCPEATDRHFRRRGVVESSPRRCDRTTIDHAVGQADISTSSRVRCTPTARCRHIRQGGSDRDEKGLWLTWCPSSYAAGTRGHTVGALSLSHRGPAEGSGSGCART